MRWKRVRWRRNVYGPSPMSKVRFVTHVSDMDPPLMAELEGEISNSDIATEEVPAGQAALVEAVSVANLP